MSKTKVTGARSAKARAGAKRTRLTLFGTSAVAKAARKYKFGKISALRDPAKFVLVYDGLDDPSSAKVALVKKRLAPAIVEEVLPGTLRVSGDKIDIKRSARGLSSWSLAPEGAMTDVPPSQGKLRIA